MIRFQKHCGKFFIYAKNNFIFILGVFSVLSKQRYIATVAKIMTHFSLIQVQCCVPCFHARFKAQ